MQFKNKAFNKFWRFSTSLQLGIPVMVVITVLIAAGTIIEAKYDAYAAKQYVYSSWIMFMAMGLLCYNLAIVAVDRWPWKVKHAPFLFVHAGIIILIFGGWVTQKFGVDGSMPIPIGSKNNLVTVPETDFVVYATFDGDRYTKYSDLEVDFFNHPPTKEQPLIINVGDKKLQVLEYVKYARVNRKLIKSEEEQVGSSVKVQLQNANVSQVETLTQPAINKAADVNLGPLKIYLGHNVDSDGRKNLSINEIYLNKKDSTHIQFELFKKDEKQSFKKGELTLGDIVETGWMGLTLKLIDYIPQAKELWDVKPVESPTPLTTAAVKIQYESKEPQWLLLNDVIKIFSDNAAYLVSYQNRRIDLGFSIYLKKFEKENYHGTMKAKEYSSLVEYEVDHQQVSSLISMNEPLKLNRFTFYQASFNEDEKTGEPVASVLSVNFDPGRWIKYLGSLLLSIGVVWFFYQQRKRRTAIGN